jgi:predicted NBD/HSP70 family sugar kinase
LQNISCEYSADDIINEIENILKEQIEKLIKKNKAKSILGIGIAVPGYYSESSNSANRNYGNVNYITSESVDELQKAFKLPVFIENDANCGALAQYWFEKNYGRSNLVFITADRGVGAGIIINGSLYKGSFGTAGEIGHVSINYNGPRCSCGNKGCLELYCSSIKLAENYKELTGRESDIDSILKLVKNGDGDARKSFSPIAGALSAGLINLVNIIDPELIIISDKLSEAGDYLIETLKQTLSNSIDAEKADKLLIMLSPFGKDSILCGSAALVLDNLMVQPTKIFKHKRK